MLSGPRSVTPELRSCPSSWCSVSLSLAASMHWLGTTTDLCHAAERLSRQSTPECWVIIPLCSVARPLMWDRPWFHRETTAKIHAIFMQLRFVFLLEENELISLRASNLYYNTTSPHCPLTKDCIHQICFSISTEQWSLGLISESESARNEDFFRFTVILYFVNLKTKNTPPTTHQMSDVQ